jgi:hypothetical protein
VEKGNRITFLPPDTSEDIYVEQKFHLGGKYDKGEEKKVENVKEKGAKTKDKRGNLKKG